MPPQFQIVLSLCLDVHGPASQLQEQIPASQILTSVEVMSMMGLSDPASLIKLKHNFLQVSRDPEEFD